MTLLARQGSGVAAVFAALALLAPSAAQAAAPTATTRAATSIKMDSATLNGTVDPNGHATVYFFRVGTTTLYGGLSPEFSAGSGTKAKTVSFSYGSLAPFTRYHYQLIARYGNHIVKGKDQSFKTKKQPLGLALAASPSFVRFNGSTTLSGNLGGTGNAGRQVVLQANPFPFAGFANAVNPQVTDAAGNFAFPILHVLVNTQYRVALPDKPEIVSPIVGVGVLVKVTTRIRPKPVKRGHRVRFSGVITPASDGAPVAIQRLFHGTWVTVAGATARHRTAASSKYRRRVKVRHSGTYRVLVSPGSGEFVANHGKRVKVRVSR